MNAQNLATLFRLRLLVGYLGEAAQFGWWPSAFFSASSLMFLEPVFPKTAAMAQYHAVVEAARLLHDEHLSLGSFHLFRLPEEVEQDLHDLANSPECKKFVSGHLRSREEALESLLSLAGEQCSVTPGPMLMGRLDDSGFQTMFASLAGAYRSAFTGEIKTFPYFSS